MEYCVCSVEGIYCILDSLLMNVDILAYCDDKKFTENQIAAVCASLVKALAYLHHSGISHRDIKVLISIQLSHFTSFASQSVDITIFDCCIWLAVQSGNVLLKETGEVKLGESVYLLPFERNFSLLTVSLADFGVSHKLQHERDKMKTLAGSPYWCAPE